MNSLVIISNKNNYEFNKEFYVAQFDKFFKKHIFEKIYLVFYINDLIDEYWCKCIPINDYTKGYISHLDYDEDFIRRNIDYLQRYLENDIKSDDNVVLYSDNLSIGLVNKLLKKLQSNDKQLTIIKNLEEL